MYVQLLNQALLNFSFLFLNLFLTLSRDYEDF